MRIWRWLGVRLGRLSPLAILAIGWFGMVLYANPGYLSYDSIHALADARNGEYRDLAAVIWRILDYVIPGPFGMLVVQTTCFLAGAYLVLRRSMSPRCAAACASAVLWLPPVSGTLAVIWTESHAIGWLMLGAGWLGSERRRLRIAGLGALALGAAMVPAGGLVILPLVVGLFSLADEPAGQLTRSASVAAHGSPLAPPWRWRRLAVGLAAWLATAVVAVGLASRFPDRTNAEQALLDIAGTLHHSAPVSDAELRPAFASPPAAGLDALARSAYDPGASLAELRAAATRTFGATPRDAAMRTRGAIVSANRGAYLGYRWDVFRRLIQLANRPTDSQAYIWFTASQDLSGSAGLIKHDARPSKLQRVLQPAMAWLGTTWLFVPYVYLLLAIALVPLCLRDRDAGALIGTGLAGALAAFFIGADPLFRGSLWLAVTAVLGAVILFTRRRRSAHGSARGPQISTTRGD